jgi:hypothetical protein
MNLSDLGVMVGVFFGSVMLLGYVGMAVKIPKTVYLAVLFVEIGLLFAFRHLSSKREPGFMLSWVSFKFYQPRRVTVGVIPKPIPGDGKKLKNSRV